MCPEEKEPLSLLLFFWLSGAIEDNICMADVWNVAMHWRQPESWTQGLEELAWEAGNEHRSWNVYIHAYIHYHDKDLPRLGRPTNA